MIDPSFDTVVHPYPPTMKELEVKIADLENKLSRRSRSWEVTSSHLQRRVAQIESFEGALKHNEWDFDNDTIQSLADFFDIQLEREYEVTITVTFSGTVTAPMDYDMDDLGNDLSASIDTYYSVNSNVEVELSENSMEIDYQEY